MSTSDPAPGSTASLRTANQRRVLDVLRGQGPVVAPTDGPAEGQITQAELARTTGLAPATVSSIVRELAGAGLVATVKGSGRRGTTVQLASSAGVVAGIDFGHRHVSVAVGDLTGQVVCEASRPLGPAHHYDEGLGHAAEMLASMLTDLALEADAVRTVGLGLPAPIIDDVVRSSAILPGWVGVNAKRVAMERFAGPVHIENDANLGALAEHRLGSARGHSTMIYLKLSSGVGSGIVIDDRLFHGASGTAGEVGHLTVDEHGPVCRCGSRGCLETYASTGSVLELMATHMPDATLDDVVEAARGGNVSAVRSLEDAGLHLGWGLGSLVNLFNPSLIVIGGDLARAGDLLLDSARVGLRRHALDAVAATPVVVSELGRRAALVGSVLLAAERTDLLPEAASG
ncbi:ROK family transcriptional regulator [Nocardioides plantarum]|uniref:ROK family protein n=1 Tax=Nocardioides plantarum TaxID=29299 RepID=A0ABV5KE77_9ACTN|nr:ROK family transcriptional regulator [Nocardioides plantarum]